MSNTDMEVLIEDTLGPVQELPTLPEIVLQINKLIQHPKTTAEDIGELISRDPSLTLSIMKLVNSAFYGFPSRITTIHHAVAILGFNTIKNLVLTATIVSSFKKHDNKTFGMLDFWKHSIAVGALGKVIAKKINFAQAEEVFIAGLLHGIGKLIFSQKKDQVYETILKEAIKQNKHSTELELSTFGFTFADVGYWLTKTWGLPRELCESVKFHHYPDLEADSFLLSSIVHISDILVRGLGVGSSGEPFVPKVNKDSWETLNLTDKEIQDILHTGSIEIEKSLNLLQIF